MATVEHSETNGRVERAVQTIKNKVRKLGKNWTEVIALAVANYNRTKHSSTGLVPADIILNVKSDLNRASDALEILVSDEELVNFVKQNTDGYQKKCETLLKEDLNAKNQMKRYFKHSDDEIKVGEVVKMHYAAGANYKNKETKSKYTWIGPLRISKIVDDDHVNLAAIVDINDTSKDLNCIDNVNINRCMKMSRRNPNWADPDEYEPLGLTKKQIFNMKVSSLIGKYILIDAKGYEDLDLIVGKVIRFEPADGTFAIEYEIEELAEVDEHGVPLVYFENLLYKSANYKKKRAKRETFAVISRTQDGGWEYDTLNSFVEATLTKESFDNWILLDSD